MVSSDLTSDRIIEEWIDGGNGCKIKKEKCPYREPIPEYCPRPTCIHYKSKEESYCDICEGLYEGDTLYKSSDWDGGIGFDYIREIKYCPVCGRRLKKT